jgi:tRNA-dihydrouridine synthase B
MTQTLRIGSLAVDRALLLAPMEDVSTSPFRVLCRRYGADIVYTEFVSSDALARGSSKSIAKIRIDPDEHPVGVQLFGEDVDAMAEAARVAEASGPDLVDINIGCPVRKVVCKGAGAALLRDLDLAERIARAIVKAVKLPVTAKARLGWDRGDIRIVELARRLEAAGVAALTIHARTRVQAYHGAAEWSWIATARSAVGIPIVGNGDVLTPEDARRMFDETGCAGVMIGRGAIGNPWIFRDVKHYLATGRPPERPTLDERVGVLLSQLDASVAEKGERGGVIEMRRQYAPYLKGLPGAARVRAELMTVETVDKVRRILERARRELWGRGAGVATASEPPVGVA